MKRTPLAHSIQPAPLSEATLFVSSMWIFHSMNKQNISAESKYEGKAKRPVAFTRLLTMLGPVMSRKFDPSVAYCKLRKTDMALENTFIYKKPGTFEMTNHVSLFQKLKLKYRPVLSIMQSMPFLTVLETKTPCMFLLEGISPRLSSRPAWGSNLNVFFPLNNAN